jgi:hypothetical protein
MEKSLNGWPAIKAATDPNLVTILVPGTSHKIRAAKNVHVVLAAFLADWHRLMPDRLKLTQGQDVACWNYRPARLANGLSNHASATAVDVCNNTILKADGKKHMTLQEVQILKKILSSYVTHDGHHILSNGEHWGHADGMHTELSQAWDKEAGAKRDTTMADVLEVIHTLKIDTKGVRPL